MSLKIETSLPPQKSSLPTVTENANLAQNMFPALIGKFENSSLEDSDQAFYIVNLDDVVEKYRQWVKLLPRITPYYAVKCNPDIYICRELARLGARFDCASIGEIEIIESIGASPDQIIFSNPIKSPMHLQYAKQHRIDFTVFDSKEELYKIRDIFPSARLLIRLAVDDSFSVCQLNSKFGAKPKDAESLLTLAKELNLNVIGVGFHVGSGCLSPQAYEHAIRESRKLFDKAEQIGFKFEVLDIGGGYPGTWDQELVTFPSIAATISKYIDQLFPHTRIISEPGRYFVGSCATLVTRVIGKREIVKQDSVEISYYINDGLYGSFNTVIFDHFSPVPIPLKDCSGSPNYLTTIFGPTCDSLDKILSNYPFPQMSIGDVIYFHNMGAYTKCCGSAFNGFSLPKAHYVRFSELL